MRRAAEAAPVRANAWPPLPLEEWQDTLATLHRWLQMLGKTRLALSPMENHWWQVALYVTARGLTTSPMPAGRRSLEIEMDFIDHRLVARTSDGDARTLDLEPMTVAAFYRRYRELLRALDAKVRMWPVPSEVASPVPFPQDEAHAAYDADAAQRCWRVLAAAERVFRRFRAEFLGKCSPVHFWWGSFDLACTRFSGERAPVHPGGIPGLPDRITREAYSHACISAGFWPGAADAPLREPVFYAYAYPEPDGCRESVIRPAAAGYHDVLREWVLPYETMRRAPDPEALLLDFLQSTYETAAERGGWNRRALERGALADA